MKRRILIASIALCLVLCLTMALVACTGKNKQSGSVTGGTFSFQDGSRTTFTVGETFSFEGIEFTYKPTVGREITIKVTKDMIVEMPDMSTPGTKRVGVKYMGNTYYFEITVVAAESESGTLSGIKSEYFVGDVFSLTGAKLVFPSQEVDLTLDMVNTLPDMTTPGTKLVTIEYNGVSYPFSITVSAIEITSYQFRGIPEAVHGGTFDYEGFTLVVQYNNNTSETLREADVTVVDLPDLRTSGTKEFVVSRGTTRFIYTFEVANDPVYQVQSLIYDYLHTDALTDNEHSVSVGLSLLGSLSAFGNSHVFSENFSYETPADTMHDYLQAVISQYLIAYAMDQTVTLLNGTPGALLDYDELTESILSAAYDAGNDWYKLSDLFLDLLESKCILSEADVRDLKDLTARIKRIVDMQKAELLETTVYGYLSILFDLTTEDIQARLQDQTRFVTQEILIPYHFSELSSAYEHVMETISARLETVGVGDHSYEDLAKALLDALEEDIEALLDLYTEDNLPSLAKIYETKKGFFCFGEEEDRFLSAFFSTVDLAIKGDDDLYLLIADELEEMANASLAYVLMDPEFSVRDFVASYTLDYLFEASQELLPATLSAPIADAVEIIKEAFRDHKISEVEYADLEESILRKADELVDAVLSQYFDGPFTILQDALDQEEDFWLIILSDEDFLTIRNIAVQLDAMIFDTAFKTHLLSVADEIEALLIHKGIDLREYAEEYVAEYVEEYASYYLPSVISTPILDAVEIIRTALHEKQLSDVDYVKLADDVADLAIDIADELRMQVTEGPCTLLQDTLTQEEALWKSFLTDKDYLTVKNIAVQLDSIISEREYADQLLAIADLLDAFAINKGIDVRDYVIYFALDYVYDYSAEYLPSYLSESILDIVTLLRDAFRDVNLSEVDYLDLKDQIVEKAMDLADVVMTRYEDGPFTIVEDCVTNLEDLLTEFLSSDGYGLVLEIAALLDETIVQGNYEENLPIIANKIEEIAESKDIDLRFYVVSYALNYVEGYCDAYLPESLSTPILDIVTLIKDAFHDKDFSEVDYDELREAIVDKAMDLVDYVVAQYEDGPFTLLEQSIANLEELWKELLSEEEYAAMLNAAKAIDNMITEGYSESDLRDLLFSITEIRGAYESELWAREWVLDFIPFALSLAVEYLPEKEAGAFDATTELYENYFEGIRLAYVDYLGFADAVADLWIDEVHRYIDEFEEGDFTLLEDLFAKNSYLLEDYLTEKEIEACTAILRSVDTMIVSGYDRTALLSMLDALWDIKQTEFGAMPEDMIYIYVMEGLWFAGGMLPEEMGAVFNDTAALVHDYFRNAHYFTLNYRAFAEEVADLWIAEGNRYADLYQSGELSVLSDLFAYYEEAFREATDCTDEQIAEIRELLSSVDQMIMNGSDTDALRDHFFALMDVFADDIGFTPAERTGLDILSIWADGGSFDRNMKETVALVKEDAATLIAEAIGEILEVRGEDVRALAEIVESFLDAYCTEDPIYTEPLNEFFDFCLEHAIEGETEKYLMMGLTGAIFAEQVLDYFVDYNQVMASFPLPKQIESIDYNRLMSKIFSEQDVDDIFLFTDPKVSYTLTPDGALDKQIITFEIRVNYSAMVLSADITLAFSVTIDL